MVATLVGCGSVYLNSRDRDGQFPLQRSFYSPDDVATTYHRLFTTLEECLGDYGYRISGDGSREITVESGVGMPRTLYLVDAVMLKMQVEPGESSGSEVTVFQRDRYSNTFVRAAEQRVVSDYTGCRA
jgi:hypothetical protein